MAKVRDAKADEQDAVAGLFVAGIAAVGAGRELGRFGLRRRGGSGIERGSFGNLVLDRHLSAGDAYNLLGFPWSGLERVPVIGHGLIGDKRRPPGKPTGKTDGNTFEEALEEYLKGNWFEAERKLNRLLRRADHDLEARLLMATLMRHTKRYEDATHQLNLLVRLDGSHRWALEIHREGELLTEARKRTITSVDTEHESKGDN